jgi:hypothetical protein
VDDATIAARLRRLEEQVALLSSRAEAKDVVDGL